MQETSRKLPVSTKTTAPISEITMLPLQPFSPIPETKPLPSCHARYSRYPPASRCRMFRRVVSRPSCTAVFPWFFLWSPRSRHSTLKLSAFVLLHALRLPDIFRIHFTTEKRKGKRLRQNSKFVYTCSRRNCSIISAVRLMCAVSAGTSLRGYQFASASSSSCTVIRSLPSSSAKKPKSSVSVNTHGCDL